MKKKISSIRKIKTGFAAALVLLMLSGGAMWWSAERKAETSRWVDHAYEVIETLDEMLIELLSIQTGTRGLATVETSLAAVKHLTQDNPEQQRRLAIIEPLIQKKITVEKEIVDLRRRGDSSGAAQLVAAGLGKKLMDELHALISEMKHEEGQLLQQRTIQAQKLAHRTIMISAFGTLLALGLVSLAGAMVQRYLKKRQQAEARFRSIADNTPVLIWEAGLDKGYTYFNQFWLDFTGRSLAAELGNGWAEGVHPDDLARCLAIYVSSFERREPFCMEYRLRRSDGQFRILIDNGVPRFNAAGEFTGYSGSCLDITESKQAEEALRAADQKLRLHFEHAPMAIIEWDLEFRVTQWNPAAETIFGFSREEALGRHASFIIPEVFRSHVDQIWQGLLKQSGGERSSNENVSKDGRTIICEWYNTPLIDERGTFTGAASVVMDITERTLGQQLLAWEKSALELISSVAPLHDVLDGLMRDLEKQLPGALCSVLLLSDDGLHLLHGAGPSLPEAYNRLIDGLAIGPADGSCGTAAYADRQVIVSDIASDPLWADYRELALGHGLRACWSTPIHCSQGKILGTFAFYYREPRDPVPVELDLIARAVHVTSIGIERKHAEEEIRDLNASLEERVRVRTAQLELAVKELDAFSYSVSHDLRAPLRAVDGFSHMVLKGHAAQLDDEGRRMLGVILSETQRMGQLIDDLLAFSRLGQQRIEPARIDMHALAKSVFDELTALEPGRKLHLDLQQLPVASGAEAMIRQVWVNLISNAIKFTKGRTVGEIEIGTLDSGDDGTVYYVKDNGAGFDMRYAGKLFGIFQRLHGPHEFSGTGVGLALVQRIVQRHRGRVWAQAEPDRGATFYFTLPSQTP